MPRLAAFALLVSTAVATGTAVAETAPAAAPSAPPAEATAAAPAATAAPAPAPPAGPLPIQLQTHENWVVRQDPKFPGLWLGPATSELPGPDLIWVRQSPSSLADRDAVAANIRALDARDDSWEASRIEVKDINGLKCLLVRMDTGQGAEQRSSLFLKVPHGETTVDFVASAPRALFDQRLAEYERILLSVHPVEQAAQP
jgi:hypothetical protein